MVRIFHYTIAITVTLIALLAVFAYQGAPKSFADSSSSSMTGYAWSDTIGWIDLHCSNTNSCTTNNFGIAVAADGTLSGYAWSDNIGWMSANTSDLTGCPSGACKAKLSGNNLQGWLKALSAQGDGWDGWISLNGSGYGPTLSNSNFSGYAWGSDVVGWVDFSLAHTSYTPCAAHYYCSGNDLRYEDANCADTLQQTCTYQCSAGACLAPPPPAFASGIADTGIALTGHLQVAPSLLSSGVKTHVYWDIGNVTSCSVTGSNGDSWSGASSGTSGKLSAAITQQTTYRLSCTGVDGSHVSESATVNILPVFKEI